MNEVVAVFGILLAVYTYVDSLYRKSIMTIINEKSSPKARNNEILVRKLKYERKYKAVPLLMFSFTFFLLMLPDFTSTFISFLEDVLDFSNYQYSISSATIIIVPIIFFYWIIVNIRLLQKITKKIKNLSVDK